MTNQSTNLNYLAIIGAQRSGSTFLYNILSQHPDIKMYEPIRPESKYFLNHKTVSKENLTEIFSQISNKKYIGEKCTSYIEFPGISEKILNIFPDAKLMVILRNPIERAISNYQFSKDNCLENRKIEDVFINNTKPPALKKSVSVNPFNYIRRSRYYELIKPFKDKFGDNIKVIILEQLLQENIEFDIINFFLGIEDLEIKIDKKNKINNSSEKQYDNIEEVKKHIQIELSEDINKLKSFLNIDLNKYWRL